MTAPTQCIVSSMVQRDCCVTRSTPHSKVVAADRGCMTTADRSMRGRKLLNLCQQVAVIDRQNGMARWEGVVGEGAM